MNPYNDDISEYSFPFQDNDADSDYSIDDEMTRRILSAKPQKEKRVSFTKSGRFQSSRSRRSYQERGDRIVKLDAKNLVENENQRNELDFIIG